MVEIINRNTARFVGRNILINDYSGHPFPFELSQLLSKKNRIIHSYAQYFETPKANFSKKLQGKNLKIVPININKKFKKDNFLLRRSMDLNYGKKIIDLIKKNNPDIVICAQLPLDPLYKIINYCQKNKIKTIFWMQDIYSFAISKILNKKIPLLGTLIGKYYFYLEKKCEDKSDKIIVISPDYKRFIDTKNLSKTSVIENWSPIIKPNKQKIKYFKKKYNPKNKFCFMYSGTLGYKHNSNLFIKLAEQFPNSIILISSKGKFADKIKQISKRKFKNIKIIDWVKYENLSSFLSIANILIVTLGKDASTFSVPSKIYAYLTIEKPILGSMPIENLGSKIIKKIDVGYVSKPDDIESFINNAKKIIKNKKIRKFFSNNSKKYKNLKNVSINKMIKIINEKSEAAVIK